MAVVAGRWSVNALASEFGVNYRTVAKKVSRVQPVGENAHGSPVYLIKDVAHLLASAPEGAALKHDDISESQRRKLSAEAQLAELELAEKVGEVVSVEDIGAEVEKRYSAVRSRLMALPPKLAPILCPDEPAVAHAHIEAAITEALAELSGDEGPNALDNNAGSQSAA